ncbi:MAG: hypothetical protein CL670_03340 [Balneola sp.]|jgi:hypothetical protein|nr:hypothetical protein [Balneola sp.]MBE78168.1 hypothetical protein [Balneola sp.]HBX64738.1 hypothetical protein [Balneolaceae bacterium]|tara:strand:+ start:598 stop:1044 length:447 start_codon:yes stop_codon:yes gene_type:complete
MRSITQLTILICTVLLFASCEAPLFDNNTEVTDLDFELGQEFSLQYKNAIYNEREDLSIEFVEVNEGRCPMDAFCAWAGNAEVTFKVIVKGDEIDLVLNTHERLDQNLLVKEYFIQLSEVSPYPQTYQNPIPKKDYVVELKIDKVSLN